MVTELVGVNVFVVTEEEDKDSMMELPIPIGTVAGVVLGSDISSVQGLGQDLLEVALLRNHGNGEQPQQQQQQLVLIPFVPQIVPFVDVKSNRIVIDPPAGLLDLTYVREEKRTIKVGYEHCVLCVVCKIRSQSQSTNGTWYHAVSTNYYFFLCRVYCPRQNRRCDLSSFPRQTDCIHEQERRTA